MSCAKLSRHEEAILHFTEAHRCNESNCKVLLRRAECHYELKEFEDAIIDCEAAKQLEPSIEAENLIRNAQYRIHMQIPKSPLEILDVPHGASSVEIKKAYYKLSLVHHTDKHPGATKVDIIKLRRKLEVITKAYDSLKDDSTTPRRF